MSDILISTTLPQLQGYITNHYKWMEHRGNCLITIDDLQQIAAIALVKLTREWPDLAPAAKDENKMFWGLLKMRVKNAVLDYYNDVGHPERDERLNPSYDVAADGAAENDAEQKTALTVRSSSEEWAVTHERIVDYYTILSKNEKTAIALKFFDQLTQNEIITLTGIPGISTMLGRATGQWRDHARNQFTDHTVALTVRRKRKPWAPPEALHTYLRTRHRMDLDEYLGIFTLALRADPGYLPAILGNAKITNADMSTVVSPFMQAQIDKMRGDGATIQHIADTLGLNYFTVYHRLKRRAKMRGVGFHHPTRARARESAESPQKSHEHPSASISSRDGNT